MRHAGRHGGGLTHNSWGLRNYYATTRSHPHNRVQVSISGSRVRSLPRPPALFEAPQGLRGSLVAEGTVTGFIRQHERSVSESGQEETLPQTVGSWMCSCCGQVLEFLPLDVRDWVCLACGARHDQDVSAARNLLALALAG